MPTGFYDVNRAITGILHTRGEEAVKAIRTNLASTGTDATGKTSRSVRYEIRQEGDYTILEVIGGRPFFQTVETGSKPSTKNPSPDMIKSLTEWAVTRGKPAKSAWPIAKTILKEGSKLWQQGGRDTIYTNVAQDIIAKVGQDLRKASKESINKIINGD